MLSLMSILFIRTGEHHDVTVRVPTGQGKCQAICVVREMSGENIIFENSGKMILDHADCR